LDNAEDNDGWSMRAVSKRANLGLERSMPRGVRRATERGAILYVRGVVLDVVGRNACFWGRPRAGRRDAVGIPPCCEFGGMLNRGLVPNGLEVTDGAWNDVATGVPPNRPPPPAPGVEKEKDGAACGTPPAEGVNEKEVVAGAADEAGLEKENKEGCWAGWACAGVLKEKVGAAV